MNIPLIGQDNPNVDSELHKIAMAILKTIEDGNAFSIAVCLVCKNGQVMTSSRFTSGGLDLVGSLEILKNDIIIALRNQAAQMQPAPLRAQ